VASESAAIDVAAPAERVRAPAAAAAADQPRVRAPKRAQLSSIAARAAGEKAMTGNGPAPCGR
jgi:hypothetical protein